MYVRVIRPPLATEGSVTGSARQRMRVWPRPIDVTEVSGLDAERLSTIFVIAVLHMVHRSLDRLLYRFQPSICAYLSERWRHFHLLARYTTRTSSFSHINRENRRYNHRNQTTCDRCCNMADIPYTHCKGELIMSMTIPGLGCLERAPPPTVLRKCDR